MLVTGAGGGIGQAVARRLAGRGASIVAADIDGERVRAVVRELGGDSQALTLDVSDPGAVAAAVTSVGEPLTGLVGAAGVERNRYLGDLSLAEWSHVIATNLTGQFLCLRACVPALRASGGAAVLIGSPVARAAYPGAAAYAASKAGIEGLARAAAIDLASDGTRVNAVLPGTTDTPMLHGGLTGAARHELLGRVGSPVPLGRVASPEEVAAVVDFLLSDDASYVTGACWAVDGGLLARLATDE